MLCISGHRRRRYGAILVLTRDWLNSGPSGQQPCKQTVFQQKYNSVVCGGPLLAIFQKSNLEVETVLFLEGEYRLELTSKNLPLVDI